MSSKMIVWNITIYIIALFFISCVTAPKKEDNVPDFKVNNKVRKDILHDTVSDLQSNIANRYYNFERKRIINVYINEIKSNYNDEPLFAKYLYESIKEHFEKATQFLVFSSLNPKVDCKIDVHIMKCSLSNGLNIISNIIDLKDNLIVFSNTKKYSIDDFDQIKYQAFKDLYRKEEKKSIENAFLTIKGINIIHSYKERDKYIYYTRENYRRGTIDSYIVKKDTGISGIYPMEQQIIINGQSLKLNENNIFFQNKISPGSLKIIASFVEGSWDAYNNRQIRGKTHTKRFFVKLDKGAHIELDIYFINDGERVGIETKAFRKKSIFQRGSIDTRYEVIEIFSK